MDFGPYSIKNLKTFKGMEGCGGFNCTVYNGKKKIAFAIDDDSGGPVNIQYVDGWKNNPERDAIEAFAKAQDNHGFEVVEGFISEMVNTVLHERWLKRQCSKNTLFRLTSDKKENYRVVKSPYCKAVHDFLIKKYGETLIELYDAKGTRII